MFKTFGSIAALFAVLGLSACGSSSDNDDNDVAPNFARVASENAAMRARVDAMGETAAMPTQGTATYEGTGAFNVGGGQDADMLADLRLNADFASNQVGGEFSNFIGRDGRQIDGEVAIDASTRNGNAFDAIASGTLNDGGAKDVNMTMEGAFQGAEAEAVKGTLNGTIGSDTLNGDFVAEKN